jgi:hypothetical protein
MGYLCSTRVGASWEVHGNDLGRGWGCPVLAFELWRLLFEVVELDYWLRRASDMIPDWERERQLVFELDFGLGELVLTVVGKLQQLDDFFGL